MDKLAWGGYLILLCLFPANTDACSTQCLPGFLLDGCRCELCAPEHYLYKRGGELRCDRCTPRCSDDKVEVSLCTNTTNRVCYCKPGFYCPIPTKVDCRRTCLPCGAGFFSNTMSLATSCQIHTDCSRFGMVVIAEGSSTRDTLCGNRTTTSDPTSVHALVASDTPGPTTYKGLSTISIHPVSSQAFQGEGTIQQSTWAFLLLVIIVVFLVAMCLLALNKHKALKDKLKWSSLTIGKYHLAPSRASDHPKVEISVPLGDEMDSVGVQGMRSGPCPSSHQQVTMEHVGKGDSINNTVGSIFIYSPGMVILGSNSNEKKEEAEESEEEHPLVHVPQKESCCLPQEDSMGIVMQEEFSKELSFPIPATSK